MSIVPVHTGKSSRESIGGSNTRFNQEDAGEVCGESLSNVLMYGLACSAHAQHPLEQHPVAAWPCSARQLMQQQHLSCGVARRRSAMT
jgi:hypothetical protein